MNSWHERNFRVQYGKNLRNDKNYNISTTLIKKLTSLIYLLWIIEKWLMPYQTGEVAYLLIGRHLGKRKWSKSGGIDVMLLDELSQGWSKNFYPDWLKKKNDDYTNYKRKMQEQQNELIPPPTLILLRLLRMKEKDSILHYLSRLYIRM